MRKIRKIGFVAYYIQDFDFEHVIDVPVEAAVAWVKCVCPEIIMGSGIKAKDLTINKNSDTDALLNGWVNKLFIIVGLEHCKWVALCKHNDRFVLKAEGSISDE